MSSYFHDVVRNHPAHVPAWINADEVFGRRAWARRAAQSMKLGELLTAEAHAMQARGYDASVKLPTGGDHTQWPYVLVFYPGSPNQVPPAKDGEEAFLQIRLQAETAAGYVCQLSFLDDNRKRVILTMHSLHLDNHVAYLWLHTFYHLTLSAHCLPLPCATTAAA